MADGLRDTDVAVRSTQAESRMTYVEVRGATYVSVTQLASTLREKGYAEVADWLLRSATGRVTRKERIRVR